MQSLRAGYDLVYVYQDLFDITWTRIIFREVAYRRRVLSPVARDAPQVERAHINCYELHVAL